MWVGPNIGLLLLNCLLGFGSKSLTVTKGIDKVLVEIGWRTVAPTLMHHCLGPGLQRGRLGQFLAAKPPLLSVWHSHCRELKLSTWMNNAKTLPAGWKRFFPWKCDRNIPPTPLTANLCLFVLSSCPWPCKWCGVEMLKLFSLSLQLKWKSFRCLFCSLLRSCVV